MFKIVVGAPIWRLSKFMRDFDHVKPDWSQARLYRVTNELFIRVSVTDQACSVWEQRNGREAKATFWQIAVVQISWTNLEMRFL
jgi:hypothetical protein